MFTNERYAYSLPKWTRYNTFLKEKIIDSFIFLNFKSIKELPLGAIVGSSSIRRKAQLLSIRSDLNVVEFRKCSN